MSYLNGLNRKSPLWNSSRPYIIYIVKFGLIIFLFKLFWHWQTVLEVLIKTISTSYLTQLHFFFNCYIIIFVSCSQNVLEIKTIDYDNHEQRSQKKPAEIYEETNPGVNSHFRLWFVTQHTEGEMMTTSQVFQEKSLNGMISCILTTFTSTHTCIIVLFCMLSLSNSQKAKIDSS